MKNKYLVISNDVYYTADMDEKIQTELDKLKEIIAKTLPIDQIYLFGSYAYGNPHKDSDLDLYIVLKDEVEIREIDASIEIMSAICDVKTMPVDIITTKKSRYLWLKNGPTMERKIAREGILLYG